MDQTTGLVETWRANQYAANVQHLSQQKGSRLAGLVRNESFRGKMEFFDRLSTATAQLKSATRGTATPDLNIVHSRRAVTAEIYEWATLCDRMDKLENIHSPENEYAKSAMMALGRAMDDVIIAAACGAAASGEFGGTSTYHTHSQAIASVSSGIANLNVQALRNAKYIMDSQEAEGQRHIVCRAIDIQNLLGETSVTSADYNTVKALVMGEIDTFLGFKFHRVEALLAPSATYGDADNFIFNTTTGLYDSGGTDLSASYSSYKTAFAFCSDGIILGKQEGVKSFIEPRADKSYDMQVYVSMNFGAVRMEEAKVVPIFVKA